MIEKEKIIAEQTATAITVLAAKYLEFAERGIGPSELLIISIKTAAMVVGIAMEQHEWLRRQIDQADPLVPNPHVWEAAKALNTVYQLDCLIDKGTN